MSCRLVHQGHFAVSSHVYTTKYSRFNSPDGSPAKSNDVEKMLDPENMITDEMKKEEQKLHKKTIREEEEEKRKAMEVCINPTHQAGHPFHRSSSHMHDIWVGICKTHLLQELATRELREQRYKRLQFLLSKSNMYTKYLVTRMENQVSPKLQLHFSGHDDNIYQCFLSCANSNGASQHR